MYSDLTKKSFNDLTIRDLRSLLFELDNQDKKLFDVLVENVNERFTLQSKSSQQVSRYLYNFLYGYNTSNVRCKVCGETFNNSFYDNEHFTNAIRFNHQDETGDDYCCLYYFDKKDELEDYEGE